MSMEACVGKLLKRTSGRRLLGGQWIEPLEARRHLSADLSGAISFVSQLSISANADGSSPIPEGLLKKTVHLGPNGHATFRVSVKVPLGFTPGTYHAVADVDPANVFGDTNLSNNTAVSANTMTVLPPFPNLLGTWSGPVVVKTGFGKGSRGIQTDIFTTDSQANGSFTVEGSNFINGVTLDLVGSGSITTKGVFQDSGADVPADAVGTFTGKGKVVGSKLTIAYRNAINSGTITLTHIL
jgi:hypothetical protein